MPFDRPTNFSNPLAQAARAQQGIAEPSASVEDVLGGLRGGKLSPEMLLQLLALLLGAGRAPALPTAPPTPAEEENPILNAMLGGGGL